MTPDPALLGDIYRRPEFLWAGWQEAFGDWLRRLFAASFAEGSIVPWIAFGVVCAAVGAGLYIWLRHRKPRQTPQRLTDAGLSATPSLADLEAEANRLADAGDWAGAVRRLLQAFVLRLDHLGVLAHDPARTHRELRRRLRNAGPFEPALGQLIGAAEAVMYAGVPGDASLWITARDAYNRLVRGLTEWDGRP